MSRCAFIYRRAVLHFICVHYWCFVFQGRKIAMKEHARSESGIFTHIRFVTHSTSLTSIRVILFVITVVAGVSQGTQYYVDTGGSDDANGLSWDTAFASIGKAITVSANSDVVDVNEGTFTER